MTVWLYKAVPVGATDRSAQQAGELSAQSAADVRGALRRVGLQVVDLRPVRRQTIEALPETGGGGGGAGVAAAALRLLHGHMRNRRRHERAELYDGLSTMLGSGVPLLEALDTVVGSTSVSRVRTMLVDLREQIRSGLALGQAMERHPTWFDPTEIAMVRAGQHGGTLGEVLQRLAERHQRAGELAGKLVGALAYPAIVALVGLGVVVFLSVKTLPELVGILDDARVEPPGLTVAVMAFGRMLARHWLLILLAIPLLVVLGGLIAHLAASRGLEPPQWVRRFSPRVLRRMAVARLSLQLAELLRTGVPVVDAIRVLAPTMPGSALRRRLLAAADGIEHGAELSEALSDDHWFDTEFRRLLDIGQASGELDDLLERIGHRYERQARRLIERLAVLLEPCVILVLAALIGVVVMAVVLALLRIREVL